MFDTTLFLPRWNSTASQTTILILQNTTNATVTGSVYFYDGAGALLATEAVSVPEHGVQLLSTASVPALAGQLGLGGDRAARRVRGARRQGGRAGARHRLHVRHRDHADPVLTRDAC